LGFSAKAIFIKLAYAEHPHIDAITTLALAYWLLDEPVTYLPMAGTGRVFTPPIN